jgi:hypothetical protein
LCKIIHDEKAAPVAAVHPAGTTINTVQVSGTMRKYEVSGTLFASNQIQAGAYIKFDAGSKIVLQPGFKASLGSKLKAFIEGCGGVH